MRQAIESACLNYLARREHSRVELRRKVLRKGFPAELIDGVITDLHERGLQSDARCASALARDRVARGYGVIWIGQDLRQRGLAECDASELADTDWDAQIGRVHARKFGEAPPDSPREQATRERYLRRRGFSGDEIRRLFRRLRDGASEDSNYERNDG